MHLTFTLLVSCSASTDFSIPCSTVLSFLWRCVSVGVERSEFMHMHFVLHSCLNLEPLGDQLQPYLKRRGGMVNWGSVLQSRNSQLQLWMAVLGVLSWNCGIISYLFRFEHTLDFFFLKTKATISTKLEWTRNLDWDEVGMDASQKIY